MTSTSSQFNAVCAQALAALARPAFEFAKSHPDNSVDELTRSFCETFKLPSLVSSGPVLPPVPAVLAPPNIMGGAMPGFGFGMAPPQPPPAGTGTTGGRRSKKGEKVPQPWITLDQFKEILARGERVCTYSPPRDPHKDMVCGASTLDPSTSGDNDYTKWRCPNCVDKKGQIGKKMGQVTSAPPPALNDFQTPSFTGGSSSMVGSLPGLSSSSVHGLPTSIPGLPGDLASFAPPEPKPRASLELQPREGLARETYLGNNDDNRSLVFKVTGSGSNMTASCIGRYTGSIDVAEVPADYATRIVPLDASDIAVCKAYGVAYVPRSAPVQAVPSVPFPTPLSPLGALGDLPPLPGFPGLPGMPL